MRRIRGCTCYNVEQLTCKFFQYSYNSLWFLLQNSITRLLSNYCDLSHVTSVQEIVQNHDSTLYKMLVTVKGKSCLKDMIRISIV